MTKKKNSPKTPLNCLFHSVCARKLNSLTNCPSRNSLPPSSYNYIAIKTTVARRVKSIALIGAMTANPAAGVENVVDSGRLIPVADGADVGELVAVTPVEYPS